jgi:small-conductance mechanosensitive channel
MSTPDPGTASGAILASPSATLLGTPLAAFLEEGATWASIVVPIAVALLIAFLLDRALSRRGKDLAQTVIRGDISPETGTRLRFIRRLLDALIVVLGVAIALSRVEGVDRLAASLLASGAIAAAVVGFAARQTLANFVAGVMLAVTQPLRVGDWVFFEDQYGVVDDIRLTYTFLQTLAGQRVVIPNEKLASGILRNDTLGDGAVGLDVHIWLPPTADAGRAVELLREATGQTVTVAETAADGVRLAVGGERCPPPERAAREAELRLRCLELLRADGLLAAPE